MSFNLYSLTLQPPSSISQAVGGSFSSPNAHEFCVVRGESMLEILEQNSKTGKLQTLYRENVFGKVRSLASLRLNGHRHDLIVLTSDSGKLSILRFTTGAAAGGGFERLYCESFGKSGVRRAVPGEYIAVDPQGRCLMIAAVEKDKLVFGTNRDSEDKLFVASPLEAHRANSITFALAALDVGFDNPVFAALESQYEAPTSGGGGGGVERQIVLYEVDLGLNHVVRKFQRRVSNTANHLIALPDGQGVLVCSEDGLERISLKDSSTGQGTYVAIPRRELDSPVSSPVLVVASAVFKNKDTVFALVQTERGDLFKFDSSTTSSELVYLDTVSPSKRICISRNGLLFVAAEFGNHELYEIASMPQGSNMRTFTPQSDLINLERVDHLQSSAPITQFKVSDLAKDAGVNQIYTLCGRAHQSTLRVLRQGLPVTERGLIRFPMAKTDACRGVWTVQASNPSLSYVVLGFQDSTKVFCARNEMISDTEVRDVMEEDSSVGKFIKDHCTIACGNWTSNGGEMLQITTMGWRRVNLETGEVISSFSLPAGSQKKIDVASVTATQFCFAVTGGGVFYFEADSQGVPRETGRMDIGLDVACLDCERQLLAIGCWDNSVRMFQLPRMEALSSQKFPVRPFSVALIRESSAMRLEIGLVNGVLVRSVLDLGHSAGIVDTRSHVLGSKPVKLQPVWVNGKGGERQRVVLCCTSRVWLAAGSGTSPCPLSYRGCEFAAQYTSPSFQGLEGLVLFGPRNVLSLACLEGLLLGEGNDLPRFNHDSFGLDRTPRRLIKHPKMDAFVIIEGDADSFPSIPVSLAKGINATGNVSANSKPMSKRPKSNQNADDMDMDEDDDGSASVGDTSSIPKDDPIMDPELAQFHRVGYPKQAKSTWSSCIRIIHPFSGATLQRIQLPVDEMAVSLEHCRMNGEDYVFVGSVTGLVFHPLRTLEQCQIHTYKVIPTTNKLELVHLTKVEDIPSALCFFDGRLLCGSGNGLTLYELGKQKLLRKCEARNLPSLVAFIKPVTGDRLVVGDANDSVVFVSYSKQENSFAVFADDVFNRMCTVGEMVDNNTCAVGDKFGNLTVLRLPIGATGLDPKSRAAQARSSLWEAGGSSGLAPHKLEVLSHFYVGEVITAIQRVTLAPGRSELLLYGTVNGTVGSLTPFTSREDLDFFALLELVMRRHFGGLVGRDHLQFRSYFFPVKSTVDGDLCEHFTKLSLPMQQRVAKDMDRTVEDIARRLEEQRWQVMW
ncbi:hypothetical protein BASA81_007743 [Batrachochytrium salamandrivorans]|nr:hypothetical protein BASA81_007743 [Batrachochytrium salamandrivorans]